MGAGKTLTFYTGSMFSSKSEATKTHMERLDATGLSYLLLTPAKDTRDEGAVVTHNGDHLKARSVGPQDRLFDIIHSYADKEGSLPDFVIKDEVFLFTSQQLHDYVRLVEEGVFDGIANGLVYDWKADPFVLQGEVEKPRFRTMEEFLSLDVVMPIFRHAICSCGQVAWHTYDRLHGKDAQGQVKIGGSERYEALCTPCYSKALVSLGMDPTTKNLHFYEQQWRS